MYVLTSVATVSCSQPQSRCHHVSLTDQSSQATLARKGTLSAMFVYTISTLTSIPVRGVLMMFTRLSRHVVWTRGRFLQDNQCAKAWQTKFNRLPAEVGFKPPAPTRASAPMGFVEEGGSGFSVSEGSSSSTISTWSSARMRLWRLWRWRSRFCV